MSVIFLLILASLAIAGVFLGAYLWAVRAGQFDDTSTPALRMLADEATNTALPVSVRPAANRSQVLNGDRPRLLARTAHLRIRRRHSGSGRSPSKAPSRATPSEGPARDVGAERTLPETENERHS
jgi:cbb3-type cytochrome oxidase maturation protein